MPSWNPKIPRTNSITGSGSPGPPVGRSRRMPLGWPVVPDEESMAAPSDFPGARGGGVPADHGVIGFPAGGLGARAGHQHAVKAGALRGDGLGHLSPGD